MSEISNLGFATFDVIYYLIENLEVQLENFKKEKYASDDIEIIFKVLEQIINKSKKINIVLRKEYLKERIELKNSILNKINDFFNNLIKYFVPIFQDLCFSSMNYIDYDDYEIVNYVIDRMREISFFNEENIVCLISSSLSKVNFYIFSKIFEDEALEFLNKFDSEYPQYNFKEFKIEIPKYNIHIKYPLVFKDNFLIKSTIFHELAHFIDNELKISKSIEISYETEKNLYSSDIDYLSEEEEFNFKQNLKNTIDHWIKEFVADIISTIIIGPASRYLMFYWTLLAGNNIYDEDHPPDYIRCSYITRFLSVLYKNLPIEDELIEYSKYMYESYEPLDDIVFKIAEKTFENNMQLIIDYCVKKVELPSKQILDDLISRRNLVEELIDFNLPIGAYLEGEVVKDQPRNYNYTQLSTIINIFWEYYFINILNPKIEIEKKLEIFEIIESRAKKTIDIYRGTKKYLESEIKKNDVI